ncbi:MAG: hypothetical protein IIB44_11715 [Candidatus Marinimicrobia bacterium]|nr:hypothetical protein [Candidatus Neomarinimicrobiota bacterium]
MKLPENSLINREKLTQYLLVPRKRNDKSQWLAEAGYTLDNCQILETDLRNLILTIDATPTEKTKFGQMFEISGELFGPNGNSLSVITIWMTEIESKTTKFITMYPDKRRK